MTKKILVLLLLVFMALVPASGAPAAQSDQERIQALEQQLLAMQEEIKKLRREAGEPAEPAGEAPKPAKSADKAPAQPDEWQRGWLARLYTLPSSQPFDITDSLPVTELGQFDTTKSAVGFGDFTTPLDMQATGNSILWYGAGELPVESEGNYTFYLTFDPRGSDSRYMVGALFVGGRLIGQGAANNTKTMVCSAPLKAGMNLVEFRIAGFIYAGKPVDNWSAKSNFSLKIKGPSDPAPLPAGEVLLIKKAR